MRFSGFPFLLALGIFFAGVSNRNSAWGYPQFIAYGYSNCAVCHYNPIGGGPLTDYGRALGATEFSAKLNSHSSNEEIASKSGFFGTPITSGIGSYLRPSFDYRGLAYMADLAGTVDKSWINMAADLNLVILTPSKKIYASGTIGYIPAPKGGNKTISREHYVAYRPSKEWGYYAGFMDIAFGTRIPDHLSVVRGGGDLGLGQNDQVHGFMLNHVFTDQQIAIHAFLGNLFQDSPIRQKGASVFYEYDAASRYRLGTSAIYSQSSARKRGAFAVHSRQALKGGAALLAELGVTFNQLKGTQADFGTYAFLQSFQRLRRGLQFFMDFEYLTRSDVGDRIHRIQAGPGLIYSPAPRIELRTEIQGYRTLAGTQDSTTLDNINFLGQLHVYF